MSEGRLAVCPTPIGNLEDVTLRVLSVLREADVVACEDTRRTRVLLAHHGVRAASLVSVHEHNESARAASLVARMASGAVVALVSDAGTPVVNDPGFVLVRAALDAGVRVEVLPGASAVPVALVASGLPADRWRFVGFLPRRSSELAAVFGSSETVVAFESPRRVAASLAALSRVDPSRPVAVCRELTKVHEEVVRGDAASVAERFAGGEARGEIVVVIGPAPPRDAALDPAVEALTRLVEAGARTRPAARVVAELTGVPANALYEAVQRRGE
ncbi:MAG TPA: 16S rRNA (cytidine(1402)-2'-O)-methyltransferase [Solirubrobacteraceae bacterium]|nr:16S rRNA (cytidine(1402)-2'-O)-methyltransferase [Solirubrobacteraceae bacterium]